MKQPKYDQFSFIFCNRMIRSDTGKVAKAEGSVILMVRIMELY